MNIKHSEKFPSVFVWRAPYYIPMNVEERWCTPTSLRVICWKFTCIKLTTNCKAWKKSQLHNKIMEIILQLFITCNTHTHTQNIWCNSHSWSSTYKDIVLRIFSCHHQTLTTNQIQKTQILSIGSSQPVYTWFFYCFKLLFLKSPKFLIPTPLGWCNPLTRDTPPLFSLFEAHL